MEFCLNFNTGYFSVGADNRMRFSSFLRLLQEAAVLHAEKIGFGEKAMNEYGLCWVMYKLELDVVRYPKFQEEVRVVTRLGGYKGFKAFRYFEVFSGEKKLAGAVSVWFALDLAARKPLHFKGDLARQLVPERVDLPEVPPDRWRPPKSLVDPHPAVISLRPADFDTNGHVNNAIYGDYLETALARRHGPFPRVKTYRIQFNHEIAGHVEAVATALAHNSDGGLGFQILAGDVVAAAGEVVLL